jgi:hypothetical protein
MTLLPLLVHQCVPCTILVRQTDALIACLNRYSIVILTGKKPPANRAVCRGRQMRHCHPQSGLLRGTHVPKSSRVRSTIMNASKRRAGPRSCDLYGQVAAMRSTQWHGLRPLIIVRGTLRAAVNVHIPGGKAMAIFSGPARLPKFPDVRYTNCNLLVLLTNKRY